MRFQLGDGLRQRLEGECFGGQLGGFLGGDHRGRRGDTRGRVGREQRRRHHAAEVLHREQQVVGHQGGLLQHVAQLADVAGPAMARQQLERIGVEALVRQAAAPRDVVGQRLDQRLEVAHALAQRGQADGQHVEAVVQVGTEGARGHHRGQLAAGGRDDAHVDALHVVAAERLHLLLLQHAQQLGLQGARHVADLVEEQRAAVGELELAVAALAIRAGVGAGGHAEELGLEQRVGDGGDVHAHERPRGAHARRVDGMREQLLAGAGLAGEQHRAVGLRHAPRLALHFHRRRAGADEAGHGVLRPALRRELLARLVELALQAAELGDERLHRRLGMVEQHHAHGTDHVAGRIAQRQAADEEGAGLVGEQVHQDGLAALDHLRHQRVRHHLLDAPAHEVGLLVAQRRQEALVAVADPHDAVAAVDHHHAHRRAGEGVEHALRGQLQQAVGVGRQGRGKSGLRGLWHGGGQSMSGLQTL